MNAQITIESREFDHAVRELAKITGRSQADVIKGECRAILGKTQEKTKKADKKKITSKYTYKQTQESSGLGWNKPAGFPPALVKYIRIDGRLHPVRKTRRKGMWGQTPKGKSKYYPNRINPLYKKMLQALKAQMKYALSQIGQSKATFIYMGNKLKLKNPSNEKEKFGGVRVPAYVNKIASKLPLKLKSLVKVHDSTKGDNYGITMVHNGRVANSSLDNGGAGGRSAFYVAFYGRLKFFRTNIKKGVFKTAERALKKYPSLRVTER